MEFKDFEFDFAWTTNTQWQLPYDEELYQNQFLIVDDMIDKSLSYISEENREICIQAGACAGIWPIKYSQAFDKVITFEPLPISHACVSENIKRCGITNIELIHTAIGLRDTKVEMTYPKPPTLAQSYGAYHVTETNTGTTVTAIDDIPLNGKRVGHIQLDVEGYEAICLKSAQSVIEEFHPVIVLEDRQFAHMCKFNVNQTDARDWLRSRDYSMVGTVGGDVVYKYNGK